MYTSHYQNLRHTCLPVGSYQKPADSSLVLGHTPNTVINSPNRGPLLFDANIAGRPALSNINSLYRPQSPSTPIRPRIAILLPKRQQPTRPLSRASHLIRSLALTLTRRPVCTGSAVQLRECNSPRRHRIGSVSPPRRGRGLGQVEEDLAVHVALFVARHGLRSVFGQFLHLDVVGALRAFVLGGDCRVD